MVLVAGGLDLVALSVLGLAKAGWLQVALLIENANLGIARIARRDVSVQSNLGILEIQQISVVFLPWVHLAVQRVKQDQ